MRCVKSVRIRDYSGPHFPTFGLNTERYSVRMRENTDQNNSEYEHFFTQLWDFIMGLWDYEIWYNFCYSLYFYNYCHYPEAAIFQWFFKISVLKNLANLTGKHLRWSLLLIKLKILGMRLLKWDFNTALLLWILWNILEHPILQNNSGGCFWLSSFIEDVRNWCWYYYHYYVEVFCKKVTGRKCYLSFPWMLSTWSFFSLKVEYSC